MGYPRIIAHRCGGALAPENTLAGLRIAARLGVRGVEFDVMLSADGVPVLMHDETLERTTDAAGSLAGETLDQLRRHDAGSRHAPAFRGERIPTLAEAWRLCAELGLWANVEIKPARGREADTGAAVARFLADHWRADAGMISSFADQALAAARATAPSLPAALISAHIPADWPRRLAALGASALHCAAGRVRPGALAELRAAAVPVACYSVNRREAAQELFRAGVAAVFTDRPDLWVPEEM